MEAERVLRASGYNSNKQRNKIDSVAASIILSTYLELERNRTKPGEPI